MTDRPRRPTVKQLADVTRQRDDALGWLRAIADATGFPAGLSFSILPYVVKGLVEERQQATTPKEIT